MTTSVPEVTPDPTPENTPETIPLAPTQAAIAPASDVVITPTTPPEPIPVAAPAPAYTPASAPEPIALAAPIPAPAQVPVQLAPPVVADPQSPIQPLRSTRLVSLDALRGFDMLWIIGGEQVVEALHHVFNKPWSKVAWDQMNHSDWVGFRFYDLIFPMFVFIVGVSTVFSLSKTLATRSKSAALRRVILRGVFLYLIGLIFYGGLSYHFGGLYLKEHQPVPPVPPTAFLRIIADIRFMGVLQRIAIAYLFTGLFFIFFRPKVLAGIAISLLVIYWALMSFVRAPGQDHVSFDENKNLANYIDAHYLPGFKWDGDHDPEGILSTIPAIAGCMLGLFAGLLLQTPRFGPHQKFALLFLAGAIAIGLGYAWGFQFPIIKKLWTSSFVLVTAGCSAVLLSIFYLIIDVWRFRIWSWPFVWIGMNAISLYLVWNIFHLDRVAERIVGSPTAELAHHVPSQFTDLASPLVALFLILALARFLYKHKIFLRV